MPDADVIGCPGLGLEAKITSWNIATEGSTGILHEQGSIKQLCVRRSNILVVHVAAVHVLVLGISSSLLDTILMLQNCTVSDSEATQLVADLDKNHGLTCDQLQRIIGGRGNIYPSQEIKSILIAKNFSKKWGGSGVYNLVLLV